MHGFRRPDKSLAGGYGRSVQQSTTVVGPYETGCTNKWDFNVGNGLNDLIGTENLTNHGATQGTAASGAKYYAFDGSGSQYLWCATTLLVSGIFSVEFIGSPSTSKDGTIFTCSNVSVFVNVGDTHYALSAGENGGESSEITFSQLTHAVATWDGSNINWYINGGNKTTTAAPNAMPVNSWSTEIGQNRLAGDIYYVRLYNGAVLTDAQVLNNYNVEKWRIGL